jgi:hypothetical protein
MIKSTTWSSWVCNMEGELASDIIRMWWLMTPTSHFLNRLEFEKWTFLHLLRGVGWPVPSRLEKVLEWQAQRAQWRAPFGRVATRVFLAVFLRNSCHGVVSNVFHVLQWLSPKFPFHLSSRKTIRWSPVTIVHEGDMEDGHRKWGTQWFHHHFLPEKR